MIIKNAQKRHQNARSTKKVQSSTVAHKTPETHVSYDLRASRRTVYHLLIDMPVEYLADMIKNREEVQ